MLGLKGIYGNKGSITIELKMLNTSVSITNLHLFAGQSEAERRAYGLERIEQVLPDSDYYFMAGDFNFRNQISRKNYLDLMEPHDFSLRAPKQLWREMKENDEVF